MGSCYCDVLLSIQRYIYTACAKGRVISKYAHSLNYVVYNNFCSYQLILIPPPPHLYRSLWCSDWWGGKEVRVWQESRGGQGRLMAPHIARETGGIIGKPWPLYMHVPGVYIRCVRCVHLWPLSSVGWLPDTLEFEPGTSLRSMQTTQETIPLVAQDSQHGMLISILQSFLCSYSSAMFYTTTCWPVLVHVLIHFTTINHGHNYNNNVFTKYNWLFNEFHMVA